MLGNIVNVLRHAMFKKGIRVMRCNIDDRHVYKDLYSQESIENRRFYNIAAGGHFDFGCRIHHPYWTNVDLDRPWKYSPKRYNPGRDIAHDLLLMNSIPVESSSAELIHSRLTIEHITDEAALSFFKEAYRMLKPNGIFRIVVPDVDLDYEAFLDNNLHYYRWVTRIHPKLTIEQGFIYHFFTQTSLFVPITEALKTSDEEFRDVFKKKSFEEALNYLSSKCSLEIHNQFRGGHINWWNRKKIENLLRESGFNNIYHSECGKSKAFVMRNDAYFDNVYQSFMLHTDTVK